MSIREVPAASAPPIAQRRVAEGVHVDQRIPSVRGLFLFEQVAPRGMGQGILLAVLPALVLFFIFYGVPLGTVFVTSLSAWSFRSFNWIGLDNYAALFSDRTFWRAAQNTLVYCLASMLIQVPLGILAGVLVAQRLWGWRFFRAALFIPVVISGPAFALTFSVFYNPEFGLLNSLLGWFGVLGKHDWLFNINTALPSVIATYVFIFGFIMILVATEIAAIPRELYEAAEIDGATWLQRELAITLPSLRNVAGTCLLLTLLGTIKLFDVVYIMTRGGPGNRTATLGSYGYDRYLNDQWGYANAVGVLTILLGLALIVSVRRIFRIGSAD
ncbi:sugar ABC transporter permease [Devosia sp.]|uniref:carbohydrate ABC transporter permease n=1 Tax=Devosia sp. TaxID=1871048 RepID=UPI0025BB7C3F|nr:sugar ABC transporter permease [Devosia sp.]